MKIYISIIAVLVLVTMITAMPDKPKKKCAEDCPFDYEPVCGGTANSNEKKSFGNECVMRKYNCEKGANLVKIQSGECPGGGSVRLQ